MNVLPRDKFVLVVLTTWVSSFLQNYTLKGLNLRRLRWHGNVGKGEACLLSHPPPQLQPQSDKSKTKECKQYEQCYLNYD